MEDHRTAMFIISVGDWMTKNDIKESYLLVNIDPQYRKYLRFQFDKLYQFNALCYGLCSAPHIFFYKNNESCNSFKRERLQISSIFG